MIQSRDIKWTTETAFSHKLRDNSTRQKQQTCKHFEHQQEEKTAVQEWPTEQRKETLSDKQRQCVTHAVHVTHAALSLPSSV